MLKITLLSQDSNPNRPDFQYVILIPTLPLIIISEYISFPLSLYQVTHKLSGLNNTDVLFYSSRGQKSKMGVTVLQCRWQQAVFLLQSLATTHFLLLSSFQRCPHSLTHSLVHLPSEHGPEVISHLSHRSELLRLPWAHQDNPR